MAKIQTITISNFKAISDLTADFKGMTAIITGGNNKGKTSFLHGIPDRMVKAERYEKAYNKISLSEIENWANENDLQLLIERPDFDGGEIKFELIEQ